MPRALLLLLFASSPAWATVSTRLTVAQLTAEASLVVHADVVDRYVVPARGPRGEIYTRTILSVHRYLEGDGPTTLVVQQLGGHLGDLSMRVTGNARLEEGDEVVAFLDVDPARQLTFVVGLAQGVYHVRRGTGGPTVSRDLGGLAFYRAGAVEVATDPEVFSLPALRDAVGRAVQLGFGGGEVAR